MMWRLFVLTVFIFSSTITGCWKAVQIDNKLDDRKVASAISYDVFITTFEDIYVYIRGPTRISVKVEFADLTGFTDIFIAKGAVWKEPKTGEHTRDGRLVAR